MRLLASPMDPWIKRSPGLGWPLLGGHRVPVAKEPSSFAFPQPKEKEINKRKKRIKMWIMSSPTKVLRMRVYSTA
jgi:hypothetical protein